MEIRIVDDFEKYEGVAVFDLFFMIYVYILDICFMYPNIICHLIMGNLDCYNQDI